jgi:predicted PurR-regulated permease PerM
MAATFSVALVIMAGWLLVVGQGILLPVLVGIIAVYVLNRAAEALLRLPVLGRLPRRIRRLLVLLGGITGVVVLAAYVTANAAAISAALPRYRQSVDILQSRLLTFLGVKDIPDWANFGERLLGLVDATTLLPTILATISAGGTVLVAAVLYAVFILAELDFLPDKTRAAFGAGDQAERTLEMVAKINQKIGDYLAAKTLVNVILGVFSFGVMWLLGIEHAGFWAIMIGVLNYVPYVGSVIAVFFPVTISLVQFASFTQAAEALVLLTVPQMAIAYYVEPKFLGRTVNLSPFTVLLSLAVWSALWGMMGAVLAIPLTAMVAIILAEIPSTRFVAVLMSDNGDV